ncbi:FAD-dependent oxidoreductase [Quadrisphaera sp. INWT6]|uniref:FAD-dependent oxidoreductase n=1 Tax=Quadrisphaera sp. INWT6 TaxID=2596917 RepID=UPI001892878F|nr:FAD-dependent oxidoreductase [Quadrisphaera sp. INWT6]MBF5082967.1 FAD-dependent oxidoreductase [Quadrisphaera sp. INWT6]
MSAAERTTCAVVGGGPAGVVLGLLLARAGVEVTVLEAHADFRRDFRGDTVHPSTLALLDDLGLCERFDALPQTAVRTVELVGADDVVVADLDRLGRLLGGVLPVLRHPRIALVPQWDLLDLLATAAQEEPTFTLRRSTRVTGLLTGPARETPTGSRVTGVRWTSTDGSGATGELEADLVVACDGRWSTARGAAELALRERPVPFDVWWFRLPLPDDDADARLLPVTAPGRALVVIPRRTDEGRYLQIAYLGPKGADAALRARGVEAFRRDVAELLPDRAGTALDPGAIRSMDDVSVLDVRLSRLPLWHREGLLCLGDAAHAMSPVGGVGINLAVQDAVAAARVLARPLREGRVRRAHLARVQRRRALPAALVQVAQHAAHQRVLAPVLAGRRAGPPRAVVALLRRLPWLAVVPAYAVGVGARPERAPRWARRPPAP